MRSTFNHLISKQKIRFDKPLIIAAIVPVLISFCLWGFTAHSNAPTPFTAGPQKLATEKDFVDISQNHIIDTHAESPFFLQLELEEEIESFNSRKSKSIARDHTVVPHFQQLSRISPLVGYTLAINHYRTTPLFIKYCIFLI